VHDKILVDKKTAAAALSVSVRTLENLLKNKEIIARKIGRRTLIPRAALESFARHDHATRRAADD
jgi:excisionase family DNA binding protein